MFCISAFILSRSDWGFNTSTAALLNPLVQAGSPLDDTSTAAPLDNNS